MRRGAERTALRGLSAAQPHADRRNLREVLHVVQHVEQRVLERQVDDRIGRRRQRLAHLVLEHLERVVAPEIVSPEKAAAQQVIAQARRLLIVHVERAGLRHHDERALRHLRIGQPQHDVLEVGDRIAADVRCGQLR